MFKTASLFKLIPAILLAAFFTFSSTAQTLSGKVIEWDEAMKMEMPVPGANVYWANTTIGTTTNTNGNFQINIPPEFPSTLVISFIGFQNDSVRIDDNSFKKVLLKKSIELKEVEVTGKQN